MFAIALGIGSLYAGFAGSLLSPISFVQSTYQWYPLIYAFVVVIIGGLGSVVGSVIGGVIFGILETCRTGDLPFERGHSRFPFDNRDHACKTAWIIRSKGKDLKFSKTILVIGLLFYAGLSVLPFFTKNQFLISSMIFVLVFALFAAAWDFGYGVAGIVNLGPGVAYGIGSYLFVHFAIANYPPVIALWLRQPSLPSLDSSTGYRASGPPEHTLQH